MGAISSSWVSFSDSHVTKKKPNSSTFFINSPKLEATNCHRSHFFLSDTLHFLHNNTLSIVCKSSEELSLLMPYPCRRKYFAMHCKFLPHRYYRTGNYGVTAGFPCTICRENPIITKEFPCNL